ncbi:MAG: acetyl-CoA carboxylase biotin carboxyl carrier protein [Pseudomonadota bacterium]
MTEKPQDSDVAFIRALAELLRENDLSEVEVKRDYADEGKLQVRVSRNAAPVTVAAQPVPVPPPLPAPVSPEAKDMPQASPAASPEDPAAHPGAVTSPMVGTVYLQPEPGTEPFVKVGSTVSEGQTVVIVEAMKTMNHIPAPKSGTVKRIVVADGDPVEFGAPLMIIE